MGGAVLGAIVGGVQGYQEKKRGEFASKQARAAALAQAKSDRQAGISQLGQQLGDVLQSDAAMVALGRAAGGATAIGSGYNFALDVSRVLSGARIQEQQAGAVYSGQMAQAQSAMWNTTLGAASSGIEAVGDWIGGYF